eukprot:752489-Pyramimonas_sp.AAC.1
MNAINTNLWRSARISWVRAGAPRRRTSRTVEAHAKKHPDCLQGALGLLSFDGFAMASATFQHHKTMDVRVLKGWVSCG